MDSIYLSKLHVPSHCIISVQFTVSVSALLTVANCASDAVHVVVLSIACAACKKSGQLTLSLTPQRGIDLSTVHPSTVSMASIVTWTTLVS